MGKITTVKSGPAKGKVNPIQKRTPVGVMEDGFKKQFELNEKQRNIVPDATSGTIAGRPGGNGYVLGSQVQ